MKILFFGDSITDAGHDRNNDYMQASYGVGYVDAIAFELLYEDPTKYEILNRGISGNRVVDLYSRIKADCWNLEPDVLSILIGVNDVWHEIGGQNGVELDRFENVYRMLLKETKEKFPNLKIILCEPFVLKGKATEEKFDRFLEVKEYAKVVARLAKEFDTAFLPLQNVFEEKAAQYGVNYYLADGVHPAKAGAKLIAEEWLKLFKTL